MTNPHRTQIRRTIRRTRRYSRAVSEIQDNAARLTARRAAADPKLAELLEELRNLGREN